MFLWTIIQWIPDGFAAAAAAAFVAFVVDIPPTNCPFVPRWIIQVLPYSDEIRANWPYYYFHSIV